MKAIRIQNNITLPNGSEVSTLMDAVPILEAEYQLSVRIVSVPSEGLFRDQGKSYMDIILPADTTVFGLTAGLPSTLERLVGRQVLFWFGPFWIFGTLSSFG